MERVFEILNKYNPVVVFILRPVLKLVDAHNHPIMGGIAACLCSVATHYIISILCGIDKLTQTELVVLHCLIWVVGLSNLLIGASRYFSCAYGDFAEFAFEVVDGEFVPTKNDPKNGHSFTMRSPQTIYFGKTGLILRLHGNKIDIQSDGYVPHQAEMAFTGKVLTLKIR